MADETQTGTGEASENTPTEAVEVSRDSDAQQATEAVSPEEFAALKKQLSTLMEKNETLIADNGKFRDQRRDAETARQKALEEQGEFKGLAESLKSELGALQEEREALTGKIQELTAAADSAKRFADYVSKRIDERMTALGKDADDLKANPAWDKLPDPLEKLELVEWFESKLGKTQPGRPMAGSPPRAKSIADDAAGKSKLFANFLKSQNR